MEPKSKKARKRLASTFISRDKYDLLPSDDINQRLGGILSISPGICRAQLHYPQTIPPSFFENLVLWPRGYHGLEAISTPYCLA